MKKIDVQYTASATYNATVDIDDVESWYLEENEKELDLTDIAEVAKQAAIYCNECMNPMVYVDHGVDEDHVSYVSWK